jgi:hypothetical protein
MFTFKSIFVELSLLSHRYACPMGLGNSNCTTRFFSLIIDWSYGVYLQLHLSDKLKTVVVVESVSETITSYCIVM